MLSRGPKEMDGSFLPFGDLAATWTVPSGIVTRLPFALALAPPLGPRLQPKCHAPQTVAIDIRSPQASTTPTDPKTTTEIVAVQRSR